MLLVLDIGNTNVCAGVWKGRAKQARLLKSWRFASERDRTADEYVNLLAEFFSRDRVSPRSIQAACLASVVPPLVPVFQEAIARLCKVSALVVDHKLDLGIKVRTRNPEEVGADRLVNAVAGHARYGGPLLVLDFGTATTVDAVSSKGDYLGGAIAPGIGISMEALFSRTAKLPRIEMAPPKAAIGDSTLESMRSGIYHGTLGAIRELVARCSAELSAREGGKAPRVIATGGWAHWLPARQLGLTAILPDLTLEGLRLIQERAGAKRSPKRPASPKKPVRRKQH